MFKRRLRRALRVARSSLRRGDSAGDSALFKAVVDPNYYAGQAGLPPGMSAADLVEHFVQRGVEAGVSPSPLFPEDAATPMRRRILEARVAGPAEGWFDASAYLDTNRDLVGSPLEPFEHFLLFGLREGRSPHPLFDARWYIENHRAGEEGKDEPAFLRYLAAAPQHGHTPNRALLPVFAHRTAASGPELARFAKVARSAAPWLRRLGPDRFTFLVGLFYSPGYDGGGAFGPEADGPERLAHFLDHGLMAGLDPGPLFQRALYRPKGDPDLSRPGAALLHFLDHGASAPAPTTLIDEAAYLDLNNDLPRAGYWAYQHFVMHGVFEGRRAGAGPHPPAPFSGGDGAARTLRNWRLFWRRSDPNIEVEDAFRIAIAAHQRLTGILASPTFQETTRRALALDPSIGDVSTFDVVVPPTNDPREAARVAILERLPRLRYDAIICAPFLRIGGADLVACLLAEAIAQDTSRRVLLLRTDKPDLERPDWLSANIDVVLISDVLEILVPSQAEEYFYSLLLGLGAKHVFNVNSNLCWRTFARYGARLARRMDLFAYFFCWDQDRNGLRTGYPSEFFSSTAAQLKAVFTDTEYLRDELLSLYRPPRDIACRIIPLFTPARALPEDLTVQATIAASRRRARPRVLWAGRLSHQKRFDLVIEIARTMPDVDFAAWGAPGLESVREFEFPANLTLNPPFASYAELGLDDCDAWLFTSAWEGMPTLVVELAIRGVSIVATMVGGLPELINDDTGYPVDAAADAGGYVTALRRAIGDPQGRVAKAVRLQTNALKRHSRASYVERLESLWRKEV